MRDPRYDILFEPVRIGPVTAKNRFFQVPHCNGMGHERPRSMSAMRGTKAEGGWAVVSTEECEIHPTSDLSPEIEGRIWDDDDIPALARMVEAVHAHGALAAIQLVHNGPTCANRYSREPPMGPRHEPVSMYDPVQARAMDKSDIADVRRWHREAAVRAMKAGFDVVTCYAGHGLSLPMHFLQRRRNTRTDEYGGSLENRVRLLREILEDTHDAVGHRCAVALRFAVDELLGSAGITSAEEGRGVVELLADLPDLWDVNVADWKNDSSTSRFSEEGSQLDYVGFVKSITKKPVVGVGRFTSPDTMVSVIKRGILDFIGAARPSIADPFLPKKIEEGRADEIRECIGCNICVAGDFTVTPIRCTQNPTMGEEWRKGWHPERILPKKSEASVLIVGGGPAGLECALWLGRRGYRVHLAEAENALGGRVARESRLPGLGEWGRVRDHRVVMLAKLSNVSTYLASRLSPDDVIALCADLPADHVVVATGARWRRDGVGRANPFPIFDHPNIFSPDDVMDGAAIEGPIVVFDDDHYYMGGVLAEKLAARGPVTLVTPANVASAWTANTLELYPINRRLRERGVRVVTAKTVASFDGDRVELACIFGGPRETLDARSVVSVTSRSPEDTLVGELRDRLSIRAIGDAFAPSTIAAAVYSGHRYARELDEPVRALPFLRDGNLPAGPSMTRRTRKLRGRIVMIVAALACIATSPPRWHLDASPPTGAPTRTSANESKGLLVAVDATRAPTVPCSGVADSSFELPPLAAAGTIVAIPADASPDAGGGAHLFLCPPGGTLGTVSIGARGGSGGGLCSSPHAPAGEQVRITRIESVPVWKRTTERRLQVSIESGGSGELALAVRSAYTTSLAARLDPPDDAFEKPVAVMLGSSGGDAGYGARWFVSVKRKAGRASSQANVSVTASSFGPCEGACAPPADAPEIVTE